SGHQRAARRRARGLRIAGGEEQPAPGELVDVGRGRTDGHAPAVAAEIAPADVVEQDDEDVRLTSEARELLLRNGRLLGKDESRLAVGAEGGGGAGDGVECWHADGSLGQITVSSRRGLSTSIAWISASENPRRRIIGTTLAKMCP